MAERFLSESVGVLVRSLNDDGALNVADALFALHFLFLDGAALPEPDASCGEDPTPDDLGCTSFASCP